MSALPVYVPKIRDGIAIIPAKGYSSRLPGKNTRMFYGKPMLAYSIETARASGLFSEIIVSTDDATTRRIAHERGAATAGREHGWYKIGTQELAGETLKALEIAPARLACVIYATAPMLAYQDLQMAADRYDPLVDSFIFAVGAEPLRDAGMFYMGTAEDFMEEVPLIGSRTRLQVISENRVCDINTQEDLERAEDMYARLHKIRPCAAS